MLFYISEEIVTQAENKNYDVIRILDDLATSVFYGRHMLYSMPLLLKRLLSITFFANKTQQVFRHFYSHYSDFGSLIDKITTHVYFQLEGEISILNKEGCISKIVIPIKLVEDDSIFTSTILLFENKKDSLLYDIVLRYYKRIFGLSSCAHKYIANTGGGDCTNEAYKGLIDQKNICLCIADSDKKHPTASKGETYSKLSTVEKKNKWLLCKLVCLENCREIENMIPFGILKDVVNSEPHLRSVYAIHEKFQNVNSSAFLFLDLKDGFKVSSYKAIKKKNIQYLSFIENLLIASNVSTKEDFENYDKMDDDKNSRSQKIYDGFGEKITHKAAAFINENNIRLEDSMFLDKQKEEWLMIGRHLIDWTCSSQPIRS